MKERIIDAAIESLRTEGLKFSVDTIASKLKISKKTVYKFFSGKEEMAYEIYKEYYRRALENVVKIEHDGNNIEIRLIE
ncbi:MAG: TetR/AcrR family transcriptional regulator, partial [Ruminococcus sp.]